MNFVNACTHVYHAQGRTIRDQVRGRTKVTSWMFTMLKVGVYIRWGQKWHRLKCCFCFCVHLFADALLPCAYFNLSTSESAVRVRDLWHALFDMLVVYFGSWWASFRNWVGRLPFEEKFHKKVASLLQRFWSLLHFSWGAFLHGTWNIFQRAHTSEQTMGTTDVQVHAQWVQMCKQITGFHFIGFHCAKCFWCCIEKLKENLANKN